MQKIAGYCIIFLFLGYWITTLLFSMPDNFFKITFNQADQLFQSAFFQRWDFFAPPPQYNDKLYYVVRDKETKEVICTLESVDYILKQKQKKAPFNQEETVLDYVISTSINLLTNSYQEHMQVLAYSIPDSSEVYRSNKSIEMTLENDPYAFGTLFNYGVVLLKKNNIQYNNVEIKLVIAHKPLVKFKDRYTKQYANQPESIVLGTPYTAL
jgi:hypothetical protein